MKNNSKSAYSKYFNFIPDLKQEKAKKITTISLTLISSIILGVFAIKPTFTTIAKLQRQLEDDKFVDKKLQLKIDNLSILEQKYTQIEPDLEIIYNAVPKTPKAVLLVGQIQALAKDSGLILNNFQVSEVGISSDALEKNKSTSFIFDLSAQGNYDNMMSFLDKASNTLRIVSITENTIKKNDTSGNDSLTLNIKGEAYFKP